MAVKRDTESYSPAGKSGREAAIEEFARRFTAGPNQDLYQEMMLTLTRMANDEAGRGDVKLMHKAIQELRYGFKVFAPYRQTRKMAIFGSSRTAEDDPDYIAASEFARKMAILPASQAARPLSRNSPAVSPPGRIRISTRR